jgi:uncharacterized protein YdgA (DUF945 family)
MRGRCVWPPRRSGSIAPRRRRAGARGLTALDTPTRKPNLSKKTVLGVLAAAIALAYAGSTWWAGNKVKSVYDSAFAELPQQSALVRVTERSYERGFLGAVSTVTLELGCPADAAVAGAPPADPEEEDGEEAAPTPSKPLRLSFRDTIRHGPLAGGSLAAATIDSELLLDIKGQAEAKKVFGDARPFGAHTRVGFDGGYASEITLAPGQFADEGKTRVSWQGAQLRVRVDGARTEAHYELALPGFEAADLRNGVNLKMGKLGARADLDIRHGWMLATGKSTGRLEALEFTVAGKKADPDAAPAKPFPAIVLQGLDAASDATIENGLYTGTATFKGTGSVGATRIDNFEMASSTRRIDVGGYRKLAEAWTRSAAANGCIRGKASQAALRALADQLAPDLKAMAKHGPEVGVDRLLVEIDGQRAEFGYSVAMAGVTDEDLQLPGNALLLKRGVLKASGRLPVKWIEKIAETAGGSQAPSPEVAALMIEQFEQQGYLKRAGDDVTSQVEFSGGQLKLIGKPVELPAK